MKRIFPLLLVAIAAGAYFFPKAKRSDSGRLEGAACESLIQDWETLTNGAPDASRLRRLQDVAQNYLGIPLASSLPNCGYPKFLEGANRVLTAENRGVLKANPKTAALSTMFAHSVLSVVRASFEVPVPEVTRASAGFLWELSQAGWLEWQGEDGKAWERAVSSPAPSRDELAPLLSRARVPH